jgi:AbiV family abortive infection protein
MRQLTKSTLIELSKAALENAEALVGEAEKLLDGKHFARAYFLAVAAIEEIGKSALAFNAAGRDLDNPRVAKAAREKFLDHKSKIISAFGPSLHLSQKDGLEEAVEVTILRKPSMLLLRGLPPNHSFEADGFAAAQLQR